MQGEEESWPKSVGEAAERVLQLMSEEDRARLRRTARGDLIQFHFTLGLFIRNNFGLYAGNDALLRSSGCFEADGCSSAIIERAWEKLQATAPPIAGRDRP